MKNTLYIAACSAVKEIDGATWFQTFPPYGRYPVGGIIPGAPEGAEFVFDEAAAKSIIENFRAEAKKTDWPGILVDREHFSADREKTSDAMAWAKDIRQEADGSIWTRWEFTAPGKELWEGKVLINRSPLFACAKDGKTYHPLALKSIGMTNTPHFTELSTLAAAKSGSIVQKISLEYLIAKARTDANGLSHGEDGRFDGGNGSGNSGGGSFEDRLAKLAAAPVSDPKTERMKARLAKMQAKNAATKDDLEKRKARLASLRSELTKGFIALHTGK